MLFTLILSSFVYAQPKVVETRHFHFTVEAPTSATDAFISQADEVFTYVSERMGVSYYERVEVALQSMSSEACPVRGMMMFEITDDAEVESARIIVFTDTATKLEQLLGVLAHELGHFIHFNGFGEPVKSSGLTEGLASWAAGRYYLAWHQTPSLAVSVKRYLAEGRYLPLENKSRFENAYPDQSDAEDCLSRRDTLYIEWAAFTKYLIDTYGVSDFKDLLATSEIALDGGKGMLPNFAQVYGKSLEELEDAWLKSFGG